jgi:extradiol dioxygenase family protein
MNRYIFHLSIPVSDLASSRRFYVDFGVILPWNVWREEIARLEGIGARFLEPPAAMLAGTEDEHAKAYLADPSGNVIELKAYRNVQRTVGLADDP